MQKSSTFTLITGLQAASGTTQVEFMATAKTKPAEVARYGYCMMKHGKPVTVYSLQYKFPAVISDSDHSAICLAQAAAPFEYSGFTIRSAIDERKT
jgi:hypothetical protein